MTLLKAILHIVGMILIPLIIFNGFIYIIGSFIAWDLNPLHWALFTTTLGRVIYTVFFIAVLANTPKFWEEFGD
jgi:hypothetical protein